MTNKKSIRIAYYAITDSKTLGAGQWKHFVTGVWGDKLVINDDGWFSLWANDECVLADHVSELHAIKAICADYEYELVKDFRS